MKLNNLQEQQVENGINLGKTELHKKLVFGATRWMIRYGALGEGHENVTDEQRYFQAFRQYYAHAKGIREKQIEIEFQKAYLQESIELSDEATKESQKQKAKAMCARANLAIKDLEYQIEDQIRQVEEYVSIINELSPKIDRIYPNGIEDAQEKIWTDRMNYRLAKDKNARVENIPLPFEYKSQVGKLLNRPDMSAAALISGREDLKDHIEYQEKKLEAIK